MTSRNGKFNETLTVVLRSGKWFNIIKVYEVNDGKESIIINCRDKGFTDAKDELPACFPYYISAPHHDIC